MFYVRLSLSFPETIGLPSRLYNKHPAKPKQMDQTAPLKSVVLIVAFYVTFKSCYPPNRSKFGDKVERGTFLNKNIMILAPFIIVSWGLLS